ncbi:hypothetical protein ABZ990_24210 [Streptomyces sp. NPDC046203]|uniref:protein kinase domain-containing protein n=1 Tax=Streptomyces sp. NPDC046203 TaxID=3154602 RepID=UPI0033CE688A
MDETPSPPGEALDRLGDHLGEPVMARLLSDRRGSRAWKLQGRWRAVALKANTPGGGIGRDKTAELAQEDDHLRRLVGAGALSAAYRVDAGTWEGGRWLAVRWIEGVPVWKAFAPARNREGDHDVMRPRLRRIARSWAEELARMHAAGWAHADVQPTNTLITGVGRAELVDYALACGPGGGPRLPYRGALTHTTAPEIAATLLSTADGAHVQAGPAADLWGLGASLFWCWTGRRPVSYGADAERSEKLRTIARGATISLPCVRPWQFPAFEEVITACLAPSPEDRPTAATLAALPALAEDEEGAG